MNLITNADQSMAKNGVITVRTTSRRITAEEARSLDGSSEGEFAVIEVADNGEGISPENRQHIFEPFFTTKEVGKGTGLGLSVIFGIVQRHEGFILVDSTMGEGSTFSVFLPLLKCQEKEPQEKPDSLPARGSETILVADDSQEVRHIVSYILKEFGYNILAAKDGVEAVDIFRQNRGGIDLMLFDMAMPDMGGLEAYRIISCEDPGMRCILMTGYTTQEQMIEAEGLGVSIVLKPLSPKAILHKVREVLDHVKS
jgi:CheY-like chemotaxis protein